MMKKDDPAIEHVRHKELEKHHEAIKTDRYLRDFKQLDGGK